MTQKLRVLITEDNPLDAELIVSELQTAGFELEWQRVDSEAAFLGQLQSNWDIILSDYTMPGFGGLRALELLKRSGLDTPFIILSGSVGEEDAVAAMKLGAMDYLLKDRLARLGLAVRHAIEQSQLSRERKVAEDALRESRALLQGVLDHNPGMIFVKAADGRYLLVNHQFELQFGVAGAHVVGKRDEEIFSAAQAAAFKANDAQVLAAGVPLTVEEEAQHVDGTHISLVSKFPIRDAAARIYAIGGIASDITVRKRADEALKKRADELEQFRRLSVGRELKMIELKKEVNEMAQLAGRNPPYDLSFLDKPPESRIRS